MEEEEVVAKEEMKWGKVMIQIDLGKNLGKIIIDMIGGIIEVEVGVEDIVEVGIAEVEVGVAGVEAGVEEEIEAGVEVEVGVEVEAEAEVEVINNIYCYIYLGFKN